MNEDGPSLAGAFARLRRAREHLAEIDAMNQRGDFDQVSVLVTGTGTVSDTTSGFDDERLAILAGEAMYNLRVALDYLAWEICLLDGVTSAEWQRAFPICASEKIFDDFVRTRLTGLGESYRERLTEWQPFNDHPLLAELDNRVNVEKHRHLTPNETTVQRDHLSEYGNEFVLGLDVISFVPLDDGGSYRPFREVLEAMLREVKFVLEDFAPEFTRPSRDP